MVVGQAEVVKVKENKQTNNPRYPKNSSIMSDAILNLCPMPTVSASVQSKVLSVQQVGKLWLWWRGRWKGV